MRYADHGWPVIPLHTPTAVGCSCSRPTDCGSPGKHPRTEHGLRDATIDPLEVRSWWNRWPEANVGIATGPASGLLVLDVDLPDGPDSLAQIEARYGRLPSTCEQRTGSGGRQLLFAHPAQPIGNRTGALPGIDVRGDGGYVVVPPSRHASGERYRWTGRAPAAAAPDWLVTLLTRDRTHQRPRTVPSAMPTAVPPPEALSRYGTAALDRELADLARAVEGTRNDSLNRAAFKLGQLVGAGALDAEQVADRLEEVGTRLGLGPAEVRRTIASGLTAGVEHPRSVPGNATAAPPAMVEGGTSRAPVRRRVRSR